RTNFNDFMEIYDRDLIKGFRQFLEEGSIEIITCGATHGYFPLIGEDACINLQVKTAVETHKKHFGTSPKGIWMPESAYRPSYPWKRPVGDGYSQEEYDRFGVEEFLIEHGIEYTFIDSHMLKGGQAIGAYAERFKGLQILIDQAKKARQPKPLKDLSPYQLYSIVSSRKSDKGLTLFTRDPHTGLQVWSGEHGYPGDGWYLDFHKKRFPGGLRYWKVTSPKCGLGDKEIYNPEEIEGRLDENASHFVDLIHKQLEEHKNSTGNPGVLTAPYDAELFGHWWFEGVRFLKKVYQKLDSSELVDSATANEAQSEFFPEVAVNIPEGSWGEDGFHYIWLNKETEWTWRDLYRDEISVIDIVEKAKDSEDTTLIDLATQLVRELMLAHSSDWQFLISTWSARDYAEMRFAHHHNAIEKLLGIIEDYLSSGEITEGGKFYLEEIKKQDHPFSNLKIEWLINLE
ncbi:1,4-alpha-glucan branching protein domain-containing protein, partial [candidate division KSB1 bacterium]